MKSYVVASLGVLVFLIGVLYASSIENAKLKADLDDANMSIETYRMDRKQAQIDAERMAKNLMSCQENLRAKTVESESGSPSSPRVKSRR
jgi:hypothetical protein